MPFVIYYFCHYFYFCKCIKNNRVDLQSQLVVIVILFVVGHHNHRRTVCFPVVL